MFKKYAILLIQVVAALGLYYMLSDYIDGYIILIGFVSIALLLVAYGYTGRKGYAFYLESLCDAPKYLENVNKKLGSKDESHLSLYRAYGNLFNGDIESLESDIRNIDVSLLTKKERFMLEEIKLKLLYNNKDAKEYQIKLIEVTNGEFNKEYANDLLVLKAPLLLLKKQYPELVTLMFELIPIQKKRFRVIELEYYLSLAYIAQGKDNDAEAVLEFVVKRDFKLDFTKKCKELLDKIQSN